MNKNEKCLDKGEIAAGMVLFGFAGLILTTVLANFIGTISIILFIVEVLSIIIGLIMLEIENNSNKAAHMANINTFQKEYDEYTFKLGIVKSDTQVTLIEADADDFEMEIPHYLWIANECINLFPMAQYYINWYTSSVERPNVSELRIKTIPIKSILYFEKIGGIYRYEIEIPEKSMVKNLLFGEAIFDASGEVLGVKNIVNTKIVTEDNRKVELVYKKGKNKKETLIFKYDVYEIFQTLIPSKKLGE